jgi:hypothetical protein
MNTPKNKNVLTLALVSALVSILFSFMGAPFLRALFVSSRSRVFWSTAVLLVGALFVAGVTNYKISETAVYVGATWMTLGIYSELEKRGVNWRRASLASIITGLLFALAGYFLILKRIDTGDSLTQMLEPLRIAMNQAFPDKPMEAGSLVKFLPGIFAASLFGSLALSFALESKVTRMFRIQRERVASGLRWLEFKLPDVVVWVTLFAALFSEFSFGQKTLETISVNLLILAAVAFFFQGVTVVEFMVRFYKFGLFTRTLTYLLIVLQLAPFVVFVGFVDYWADFRTLVRKKTKTT